MRLHRIRNDQLYHRDLGDPLEVLMLLPDGGHRVEVVGSNILNGERLQPFLPGDTFHTARVRDGGQWFLGASTEWPGVDPSDVEPGEADALAETYPDAADLIRSFTA